MDGRGIPWACAFLTGGLADAVGRFAGWRQKFEARARAMGLLDRPDERFDDRRFARARSA